MQRRLLLSFGVYVELGLKKLSDFQEEKPKGDCMYSGIRGTEGIVLFGAFAGVVVLDWLTTLLRIFWGLRPNSRLSH